MTRNVLVPLDGSAASAAILDSARPFLAEPGLSIVLLGVVPSEGPAAELVETEDRLQGQLDATAERLRSQGRTVSVDLAHGDPAGLILERSRALGAELLVMSTHGRRGVQRWVRGSVAERVLRNTEVPLLLANPRALTGGLGEPAPRRILVPLDGSPLADRILPLVARLAKSFQAEVTLLRVEPFLPNEAAPLAQGWDPSWLVATLEPQEQRLAAEGISVSRQAAYGIEAVEILGAAEKADLVAMTTHGRSGPSRWWFGSVAEQVLRECTCPLLVLRAAA